MEQALMVNAPQAAPIVPTETTALLSVIERAATNPAVDMDKLERLLIMHERILAKTAETAFNEAMNAAQAEMGRISTDCENKQTRSLYASYGQLDRHIRPVYARHGFSLSFDSGDAPAPEMVRVLCIVSKGGFSRTYHLDVPADGKGAKGGDVMTKTHAVGSGVAYGRRYLLAMIFNIAIGDDDDDGNGAGAKDVITSDQVAALQALAIDVKADMPKFLAHLKVERLDQLHANAYRSAVAALESKRAQAKKVAA